MSQNSKLSRHECRELIFKLLFAREFDKDTDAADFYKNNTEEVEKTIPEYVPNVFNGVLASLDELDEEIGAASVNWKVSRMSTAARTILRLAVYEMTVCEVPPKVEINEALELVKLYDEETAVSFVNGILNKIARDRGLISE